jgi:hypothetical protein
MVDAYRDSFADGKARQEKLPENLLSVANEILMKNDLAPVDHAIE